MAELNCMSSVSDCRYTWTFFFILPAIDMCTCMFVEVNWPQGQLSGAGVYCQVTYAISEGSFTDLKGRRLRSSDRGQNLTFLSPFLQRERERERHVRASRHKPTLFTTKAFSVHAASLTTISTLYRVTVKDSDILDIVHILGVSKNNSKDWRGKVGFLPC